MTRDIIQDVFELKIKKTEKRLKIILAENCGFCFGVQNAIDIAVKNASKATYTYGEIIHNEYVINKLKKLGVVALDNLDDITEGKIIIRSHGVGKDVYERIKDTGLEVIDATCPFVKKIHNIVENHFKDGYKIVIIGESTHPEVIGINGWCGNNATVIDEDFDPQQFLFDEKLCFVAQTTFSTEKYLKIIEKIQKLPLKIVELFDTICYTTSKRQNEAKRLASECDEMLVIGSLNSSNTTKLFEVVSSVCKRCYHITDVADLKKIKFLPTKTIGIVAGASTPAELIMEVKGYMTQKFSEVLNQQFIDGVEESLVSYKEGKRVKGTVIGSDENGIHVNIGGKKDGLIPKTEISMDDSFNPGDFAIGSEIEAIIIAKQDLESGCVLLSKKKVDQIKEGDKFVETIRGGEVFELVCDKETKGGLLGKMGTYTIFVPGSQIKETFVKDLKTFVGKKLRLTALEIDDAKHKIVASQRKVLETERKEHEEIFWSHVQPNVIVHGKVKRVTNFGAFVSVDGFDCLAHIVDLSWNHIKNVEEVLTIGQSYDFVVLTVDQEKGRVSLGFKQLQPHPFVKCIEEHPIGSITKGKVVSLVKFGAFVEIADGIEGLVHVSEAAHSYVKDINDIVKVGDIVDVMIMNADEASRKITLSIKACTPDDNNMQQEESINAQIGDERPENKNIEKFEERKEKKAAPRKIKERTSAPVDSKEWSEDTANNPFADLLRNLDVKE